MRVFFALFSLLVIISCANQGNLLRGVKDETPPELLQASPENGTLNFSADGFELFFDENIQLKDVNKNLLVSPFLDEDPLIRTKAKSIHVKFMQELEPNTTYSFNFGNSITDLNEGNPLSGFTYVFSTGETIDSASLKGRAIVSSTGLLPEVGAWALLYRNQTDTAFQRIAPDYATPITEEGLFHFQNIKEGTYRIYGLRDNNFNYYNDLPNEEIAYLDTVLTVRNETEIDMPLSFFNPMPRNGFVRKFKNDKPFSFLAETSTKTNFFSFQFFPKEAKPTFRNNYVDSIRFWYTPNEPVADSVVAYFHDISIDTIEMNLSKKEIADSTFKVKINHASSFSFHKPISITSSKPFSLSDSTRQVLLEDSLYVAGGVQFVQDSLHAATYYLDFPWKYGREYILSFDDSTFIDLFGLPSDSVGAIIEVPLKEELSQITFSFSTAQEQTFPIILQLLTSKEVYTERCINDLDKELTINNLPAGTYTTKVIIDRNGNGQWDTGSFEDQVQPEEVLLFEQEIRLMANFFMNVEIDLDQQ